MYPYSNPGILTRGLSLFKNIKWGTILDGTQKTLGVINQAIPIVYQVKPIVSNAKTLFKIANGLGESSSKGNSQNNVSTSSESHNSPIFYI